MSSITAPQKPAGVRNLLLFLFVVGSFGGVVGWMVYLANNFAFN